MTELNDPILDDGFEAITDAARFLGVSRSLIYKLIGKGELPSIKIGNARRIPIRAVRGLAAANLTTQTRPDGRAYRSEETAGETAASQDFPTN
jgi:excisionase family DNA binding protein